MPYVRKTRDRWDIEVHYFGTDGWAVECSKYSGKDAYKTMCEYMANSSGRYSVRLRKHRERIEVPQIYPRSKEQPTFKYDITQTFDWEGDILTSAIATKMCDAYDRVVLQHYQTDFTELREFLEAKRAGLRLVAVKPGHGELIDRDELLEKVRSMSLDEWGDYLLWYVTEDDIHSTPAVAPSDKGPTAFLVDAEGGED